MSMDKYPLRDQIAVVTGGAGGIGTGVCQALADAGATLVITYNSSPARAEALANELAGTGHVALQASVEKSASLATLAEAVTARFGRLDILVNNAGVTRYVAHDDLDGLDDELIDRIFRVNWRGAFAGVRAMRHLLEAGDGGLVINMSSIAGTTANGSNVAYCASKAALDAMTLSLARALAPKIRVVALAPGLVDGEYAQSFDPAWRQAQIDLTPLQRLAEPADVGAAAVAVAAYLPHTTGAIIPVDGGRPLT
jgi:3-oxoacyl-[acyl-carrier protein] reductase